MRASGIRESCLAEVFLAPQYKEVTDILEQVQWRATTMVEGWSTLFTRSD